MKFRITGMSCAACSAAVERAVRGVEGVSECAVNLLSGTMNVSGGDTDAIISAVRGVGYGISEMTAKDSQILPSKSPERKRVIIRLVLSVAILLLLMYLSMGIMHGWHLPKIFYDNPGVTAVTEMLLSLLIIVINCRFFISGAKAVWRLSPNMDTLVSLGSGISFLWSAYLTIKIISGADELLHGLYYESAAMILVFISVGKLLEGIAKDRTNDSIAELVRLTPDTVRVIREGKEYIIETADAAVGDEFAVYPGERIAMDGVVISGESAVDESALTGESVPSEKRAGDNVYASGLNTHGYLRCRALSLKEDSAMANVIKAVTDAASTKAPIARLADRVSGIFVPTVLCIAFITAIIWFFVNNSLGYALERGISVLVISCPCALGLATPVAITVAGGIGARHGILYKNATALELMGRVKVAALDKTGTLTEGKMKVGEISLLDGSEDELLSVALALEEKSEHPLARAVVEYARERNVRILPCEKFSAMVGSGVEATVDGIEAYGAAYKFISEKFSVSEQAQSEYIRLSDMGMTPLFFTLGERVLGIIAVSDSISEDSRKTVGELKEMGVEVVMLTGDNERTARHVAGELGIDNVFAGLLPMDKVSVITSLKEKGVVLMVGDGINDAPSLTEADVGVAVGEATDIAIDTADAVLIRSRISSLADAVRLGRATLRTIKGNLFWAFFYNLLGIVLATGVFSALIDWQLTPAFGALAMSLSSFCVVMNALSLNFRNIFKDKKTSENTLSSKEKENEAMKKTIKVEGMMCPHCEAHVTNALLAIDGVEKVTASHKESKVEIELSKDIDDAVLKDAIIKAGYKA